MKGASIVIVFYAAAMLLQGSLEFTHDVLHYLDRLNLSSLHSHHHDHHHSAGDHIHSHHHHHHHSHSIAVEDERDGGSGLINFFFFTEEHPQFGFSRNLLAVFHLKEPLILKTACLPAVPPPKS